MNFQITINFSTDNADTLDSIKALLENSLPYMVDNVEINFDNYVVSL